MTSVYRKIHSVERIFTQGDVDAFVNLTGDSNPIHTGTKQAPIVPGLLASSLFPALIGSSYPGAIYAKQDLKFIHSILVCHPCLLNQSRHHWLIHRAPGSGIFCRWISLSLHL